MRPGIPSESTATERRNFLQLSSRLIRKMEEEVVVVTVGHQQSRFGSSQKPRTKSSQVSLSLPSSGGLVAQKFFGHGDCPYLPSQKRNFPNEGSRMSLVKSSSYLMPDFTPQGCVLLVVSSHTRETLNVVSTRTSKDGTDLLFEHTVGPRTFEFHRVRHSSVLSV